MVLVVVLVGCASTPSPEGPTIEMVPGKPGAVRLLLTKEEAFRLSRAGIMDTQSPSGLTDRSQYRAAIDRYTGEALKANGLCPRGYESLELRPARQPFDTAITVACLAP